ncbi:MAG TPA: glycoside hydrolase family 32 protein [Mycobacteriales bacterium]|nr:glycoside hydrolase family 32 protein [Mycobacteriales bacterium]
MSSPHLMPRFHVRPRTGYVNDPNGPIRFGGRYHLYFQYVHDTPRTGPVYWGHATSADLVGWTIEPEAIVPEPGGLDEGGCWSGNVVSDGEKLYAFYSAFEPESPFQPVNRAESSDGVTFGNKLRVVEAPADEGCVQFRDPFVWRQENRWCMVVGAGVANDVAQARLYESADLERWSYVGPFTQAPRQGQGTDMDTGMMWECPQYASFGDRGALFIGTWAFTGGGTNQVVSLVGTDTGDELVDPQFRPVDQGANFYAPSVLRGEDGRNLLWGWVTEGRTREWTIEDDWSGFLSLPREIQLDGDRVASYPAAELTGLRTGPVGDLDAIPAQCEIEVRFAGDGRLRLGTESGEHLDLIFDAGVLTLDRSTASRNLRADTGSDRIKLSGPVSLRWFIDGSVSEIFTSTGHVLTQRFYPLGRPPWRLSVGGAAEVTVHALRADAVVQPDRPR